MFPCLPSLPRGQDLHLHHPQKEDSCFVAADLLFALNRREHREKKEKKKKKCRSPKGPFQTLTLIIYSRVQKVPYF